MRYLLDTNIISALMKDPTGSVTVRIREVGEEAICTSIVVVAEVRYGIEKRQSIKLKKQFDQLEPSLVVVPFEAPADLQYAKLRVETEKIGLTVGQNDLLIAAQAKLLDAILVSDDRIFSKMPDLKVENWLQPGAAE